MKYGIGLAAVLTFGWCAIMQGAQFYVALDGNDSWTGKSPVPNATKTDGPLATLAAAIKAARGAREAGDANVGVQLRGGRFELTEPLALLPADSGGAAAPFTISAYQNEKPVISGGRRITGWKRMRDNLWSAEVPDVKSGQWYFRQLFVNGERRVRARTPNEGFFRIQGASPQDKPVKLKFKPGDIRKEWAGPDSDVEVVAMLAWADIRMQIREVDESNHVATLSGNPRPSNKENNAQYYVENTADALDASGEWHLDRKTGVVSYLAKPGEDMATAEVIAPVLDDLLVIRGDANAQKPVEHITIRGITFSHTDWSLGTNGYADTQAAIYQHGDVLVEHGRHIQIEDCTFTHLAGYAIEFGRGAQHGRAIGNEITDMGAGGLRLGETVIRADTFDASHSHTVTDNHIHRVGIVYPPAVGVLILQSGTNRVAHNHIHDLFYTAVSAGWTWGYRESPCRENVIEWNHMHDIGQFLLSDMGAVYTLGPQRGTVVRHNLIHDVNAFTYGGWGLYTDEGSTGIVMENNVVYRCKNAGFHQHYGKENVIRNNIFAFNKENQLMRTRDEEHVSFFLTNNIVCFDSGNLLGSSWRNNRFVIDSNLYWDTRAEGDVAKVKFSGASFEQWQARGHDANSVIADPLFVNAAKDDFRLKPGSPALKLGFKPIDLSGVGIRPGQQRNR